MHDHPSPPATAKGSRYESKGPGITRVHSSVCARSKAGKRCSCQPQYRAEVHDPATKKRAYRSFPVLEQAQRWRTDQQSIVRAGRSITDSPTIPAAWTEFEAGIRDGTVKASGGQNYRPAVIRAYESKARLYLTPRWPARKVSELRLIHVQQLVDELVASGAAAKTVRNTIVTLRAFYRFCIRREYCAANPCDHVELPSGGVPRDRIATTAEALDLLAAVPERDRAIWACAFFAGLRRGELLALDWSNVDLAERVLRVTCSYDPGSQTYGVPKTRRGTREVGIPRLLVPYLAALDRTEGLVFGPTGQTPFGAPKLHERAYAAWDAAGLERISLHSCRHTFVSHMIAAGVNIKRISEWAGHSSIQVTLDVYGHLLPGNRETVLEQLDAYHAAALDG
jgi:integrase